jgi:hypothetical protein
MSEDDPDTQKKARASQGNSDQRRPYEAPSITKKRSLARVTLFSGGAGGPAIGLTSSG